MRHLTLVALLGLVLASLPSCVCVQMRCERVCCPPTSTPPSAGGEAAEATPPAPEHLTEALYAGTGGEPQSLAVAADGWGDVDLIAFGELHGHAVGARHQFELLRMLADHERPVALAMEFLERDTQPAVDAYLAGTIDVEEFKKQARQGKDFDRTHGPLLAYCKDNDIAVIAANAPRRLVSAYRKQEADYDTWRASLPEADQALLPEETSVLEDAYRERFMALMGAERGASFFRSQSLWDDAMAEAIVDYRAEHPACRVLLIVGAFHVTSGEGTVTKYRLRRGKDAVRVITMRMSSDPRLRFEDADLGTGDLVLKVPAPKALKVAAPKRSKGAVAP
ncbi:MAG: ChaN family lipoprotein [Planctomycetota bacterium]|nr:ChaN family lipoprotein [Planctomycetota bacterium]